MRRALVGMVCAALASCGARGAEEETVAPSPAPCVPVVMRSVEDSVSALGVLDVPIDRRALVAPQAAGRLVSLHVTEGDVVLAGAPLASVESGPANDARALARARLQEAEAALVTATATRTRADRLVDRGISARAELDDSAARADMQAAAVRAARAALSEADRAARRTELFAPFAGTVVRVLRRPGELVDGSAATPVLELADRAQLEFVAELAAHPVIPLTPGAHAAITLVGERSPVDAVVRTVSPALDPLTGAITVRLALASDATPRALGQAGRAIIALGAHDARLVPASAVRSGRDGASEVLVCEGGVATRVPVTVRARRGAETELEDGPAAGTAVVREALGIDEGAPTAPPAAAATQAAPATQARP